MTELKDLHERISSAVREACIQWAHANWAQVKDGISYATLMAAISAETGQVFAVATGALLACDPDDASADEAINRYLTALREEIRDERMRMLGRMP